MDDQVKALPLWQPWASLVVHGAKRIETRHWPAPASIIGQRVAIHATKKQPPSRLILQDPFYSVMLELGMFHDPQMRGMPFGAIVGSVIVDRCEEMTLSFVTRMAREQPREYAFGYYQAGRYAWHLREPLVCADARPCTGRQGIFRVPREYIAGGTAPEWQPA